jgi:hypothetical protein
LVATTAELGFFELDEELALPDAHEEAAQERCDHLIDLLSDEFSIVEAYPTGSIPRGTAIRGHADIDIIVVLEDWEWRGDKPSQILQRVRDHLAQYKDAQIRKNGQAVTMYYDGWPQVDVVPAGNEYEGFSSESDYLVIPDMTTEQWFQSRPRTHSRALAQQAEWGGFRFLDIVRMLKWWNLKHGQYLQSFHIEAMAVEFASFDISEYGWEISRLFDAAAESIKDYNSPENYAEEYLTYKTRPEVVKRLEAAGKAASHAWYLTYNGRGRDKEAMAIWQQLFPDRFPSYG